MHTKRLRMLFLSVCFGCLFLCSCGLDEYYVIEPPTANEVLFGREDQTEMVYTLFSPAINAAASAQVSMKGIAVYYALYSEDDESKLTSDISRIRVANTEYSETGFNSMRSSSTAYQPLTFSSGNSSGEFLPVSNSRETYKITMNSFLVNLAGSDDSFMLTANNVKNGTSFQIAVKKPETTGYWYLNAYAVTVGDVSLVEHYSQLAPLGVLKFRVQ